MSNPLSPISYTNKDFNSIFTELLDLTRQLSDKWDPVVSNESDPGVVLLKTDAIIGDKNNYNIDKNILEAFPEAVTQEVNARNLYKQLAYYMPWYKSSITDITIKYIGEELTTTDEFKIPKFTMVSDVQSNIVYTLISEPIFNAENTIVSVPAIEGIITDLRINGSDVITLANLDSRNRIYFDDYSVAENGIFISNVDTTDRTPWVKVDNLLIYPSNTKCYEFGVDSRNEMCYLEFPQDIATLMESGLNIKYVVSNGSSGNISAQVIERFYQETTVDLNGNPLALNNDNFKIVNPSASVSGSDPQSISDAYLSYKKSVGTFNTLVTVRDYANAIYNSGIVSNVVVSDRTNDLQTAYTIVTDDEVNPEKVFQTKILNAYEDIINKLASVDSEYTKNGQTVTMSDLLKDAIKLYEEYIEESPKEMNAFDLKLYLLHNSGTIANIQQYEDSFTLEQITFEESPITRQVMDYISEQKCVQHDFKELKVDTPCMYQNAFPIQMKIVPTTKLTSSQINEVKVNIIKALYNVTCSRTQEFGVEPQYDVIYECIKNADERIKTVILDDFKYITYAVYWDSDIREFKEIPLNITEFNNSNLIKQFKHVSDLEDYIRVDNSTTWTSDMLNACIFLYVGENDYYNSTPLNKFDILKYDPTTKKFILYSNKMTSFQRDILVKNILAGKTPLFVPTAPFKYNISEKQLLQTSAEKVSTVSMISPYSTSDEVETKSIPWRDSEINVLAPILPSTVDNTSLAVDYTLQENENIRLLAPSFLTKRSFSNYAKFILQLNEDSGVARYDDIKNADNLELDTDYYITEDDWKIFANNCAVFYNNRFPEQDNISDIQTSGLYGILNSWLNSYCLFTGYSKETFSKEKYFRDGDLIELSAVESREKRGLESVTPVPTVGTEQIEFTFTYSYTDPDELSETITIQRVVIFNRIDVIFKNYPTDTTPSWSIVGNTSWYKGRIQRETNQSGAVLTYQISDYDPVYQTLLKKYSDGDGIKSATVCEYIKTYSIPANTDYQLKQGESITFFWREEDGDDVPYRYECYRGIDRSKETSTKKSPIIRANFNIQGESIGTTSFIRSLSERGQILNGDVGWDTVVDLYGDNDLSGTKSVDLREMNQAILDRVNGYYKKQNKIYFITSDKTSNNEYKLVLKRTGSYNIDSTDVIYTYRYTLQDNEFFIYTMGDGTSFEMLSAGTLIGIDTENGNEDTITLSVKAISVEDIKREGLTVFYSESKDIDQNYTMFCREQQIYSIVGGDTIHLLIDDRDEFWRYNSGDEKLYYPYVYKGSVNIENDLDSIQSPSIWDVYSVKSGEDDQSDENYFWTGEGWELLSSTLYTKENCVPYFCSWVDTFVKGFTLNYTSNNSEINLPKLDIQDDNDCIWCGRSYLNIRTSAENSQKIIGYASDNESKNKTSTQNIVIEDTNSDDTDYKVYPDIMKDSEGNPDYSYGISINLLSSVELDKVGGKNIDITYLDALGDRQPVTLYLYSYNEEFSEPPYTITNNGVVEVEMGTDKNYDRSVEFIEGSEYVFSIYNPSKTCKFKLKYALRDGSDYQILPTLSTGSNDFLGRGLYYYSLPYNTNSISFEFEGEPEGQERLTISKIFKCELNKILSDEDKYSSIIENRDALFSKIRELDYEGVFKYDNIPSVDRYIEDPLLAQSFFNEEHTANAYTIPRCTLRISNTTDSKITMVNNR